MLLLVALKFLLIQEVEMVVVVVVLREVLVVLKDVVVILLRSLTLYASLI